MYFDNVKVNCYNNITEWHVRKSRNGFTHFFYVIKYLKEVGFDF